MGILDAPALPLALGSKTPNGIVVPPGWGSYARAASPLRVAVHGDSVSQGMYCSNLDTKGWVPLLAADMQTQMGDGGSGWFGVMNSSAVLTALGANSTAITDYSTAGNLWTLSGSWTTNQNVGAGWQGIGSTTSGDSATTPTGKIRGRYIDIATHTTGAASFSYQIDGGATVPVTISGAGYQWTTVDTGATGTHTVVVTNTSTGQLYFTGVRGRNSTGAYIDRFATFGAKTSSMNNQGSAQSGSYSGGTNDTVPANLLIYALCLNDCATAVAADTAMLNIRYDMNGVLDNYPYGGSAQGNVDVMFVVPHIGKFDNGTTPVYQDFCDRIQGLAKHYNAALVDLFALGGRSYNWMSQQGYWGNGASPGASGADSVHLSDAGHLWMANQIKAALQYAGVM